VVNLGKVCSSLSYMFGLQSAYSRDRRLGTSRVAIVPGSRRSMANSNSNHLGQRKSVGTLAVGVVGSVSYYPQIQFLTFECNI